MKFIEMKYFEATSPYYSLIKAETYEKAKEIFVQHVADEDDLNLKEVNRDYALVRFSKAPGEDGEEISIKETLDSFQSHEEKCLVIDGNLI